MFSVSLIGIAVCQGVFGFMRNGVFIWTAFICLFVAVIITCAPVVAQSSAEFTLKGDELVDQGKYQEAISAYDQAIALEPRNARAWCGKGVALNQLGNYTEANGVLA